MRLGLAVHELQEEGPVRHGLWQGYRGRTLFERELISYFFRALKAFCTSRHAETAARHAQLTYFRVLLGAARGVHRQAPRAFLYFLLLLHAQKRQFAAWNELLTTGARPIFGPFGSI